MTDTLQQRLDRIAKNITGDGDWAETRKTIEEAADKLDELAGKQFPDDTEHIHPDRLHYERMKAVVEAARGINMCCDHNATLYSSLGAYGKALRKALKELKDVQA